MKELRAVNIIFESLLLEQGNGSLLLLDVDDTLVTAQNIYIYKVSAEGKETPLTPNEFAEEDTRAERKKGFSYDFREFRNAEKVAQSIKTGLPVISNLKIMDNYINNGWTIGILTARGMEEVMASTMREWLLFRDNKTGKLNSAAAKLARSLVFAVSDDTKSYEGIDSFEKKANVIKELAQQYNRVFLLDDDPSNIEAVNKMAEKEGLSNKIKALQAKV